MTEGEPGQRDSEGDRHLLDAGALDALRDLLGDDADAFAEVVGEFLDSAPQRLTELRTGVTSGDTELAARAAHTLKANGATFGAVGLAERCRELEALARSAPASIELDRVDAIDTEWVLVSGQLRSLVPGSAA